MGCLNAIERQITDLDLIECFKIHNEARQKFDEKKYKEALKLFEEIRQLNVYFEKTYIYISKIHKELLMYDRYLNFDIKKFDSNYKVGVRFLEEDNYTEAIRYLKIASQLLFLGYY